jgi:hypothetical protein
MDSGRDSVNLLKKLLDQFGSRLGYVLVLNQIRGDDFSILRDSGEQTRALELGAGVVSIKRLHDTVINKIDSSSCSFWAAANQTEKLVTGMGLMDRQRAKTWLKSVYKELETVGV